MISWMYVTVSSWHSLLHCTTSRLILYQVLFRWAISSEIIYFLLGSELWKAARVYLWRFVRYTLVRPETSLLIKDLIPKFSWNLLIIRRVSLKIDTFEKMATKKGLWLPLSFCMKRVIRFTKLVMKLFLDCLSVKKETLMLANSERHLSACWINDFVFCMLLWLWRKGIYCRRSWERTNRTSRV